jgi:leader peptidase (prepilin peptidase)/N-methyltransferase
MGGGDLKLMAMIGAYMGWQLALLVLFLSTLVGSIVGVTLIIISQRRGARLIGPLQQIAENDPDPQARAKAESEIEEIQANQTAWSSQIPFGPYIVLGALLAFFLGPKLIHWYFGFFHRAPEALSSLL